MIGAGEQSRRLLMGRRDRCRTQQSIRTNVSGAQRLCRVLYYYYFINEVVSLARAEPGANARMVQFTSALSSLRALQVNEKDSVSLRACGSGVEIQTRNCWILD
jgi:hypothetical protein